jgi:hypothetical protein
MVGNWPWRCLFEADLVFSGAFACHSGPKTGLWGITPGKSACVPRSAIRVAMQFSRYLCFQLHQVEFDVALPWLRELDVFRA